MTTSPPHGKPAAADEYMIIGKPVPLIDARFKVTGQAVYTDDIKLPGMLVCKILRSPLAHAKILRIDTSAAEALPGVRGVLTGREYPRTFGVLPITRDETMLAIDKVRYIGDAVAAVAADDEWIAIEACRRIKVGYEVLPVYQKPEECLLPVKEKIHEKAVENTNIMKKVDQNFGDMDAALKEAAHVVTSSFTYPGVTHAFTEPHATVAHFTPDGRLTVWSAQQVPYYLHRALTEVLGLPMHKIRVIKPKVGGGFGGKSDPFPHEIAVAALAMKTGRPVKILFDREEVFLTNHGRHPTKNTVTMTADKEGMFTGLEINALIDGGAWASFGVVTTYYNGVLSMGPYRFPSFRYSGRRVYTNKPPSGAMRGHGAVNVRNSVDAVVDVIAERIGVDPIDLRLRNILPPFTKTVNEFRITSNGIRECLEKARDRSGWDTKFRKLPLGRGIGIGCGFYISGSALPIHWDPKNFPQSTVHLKIDVDGGVTVHTGAAEIGQGSDTVAAQCVAEVLGLPLDRIRVVAVDSDLSPVDLGSYSSRVTFMMGNAARRAAEQARGQLAAAAHRLTGYSPELFAFRDERVFVKAHPEVGVSYTEALHEALADSGALIAKGMYRSPPMGGKFKGANAGLSPAYSFSAYVAELSVDLQTGFITMHKVWAAHDCGKALNPLGVQGQIEGCIHMGLGQVLGEEMIYQKGNLRNPTLLDYGIPTSMEMPDVDVIIVESIDPEGPFGAKEAGEGPLLPILPAVTNAIYDAIGVRMHEMPYSPDRVLSAMEAIGGAVKPAAPGKVDGKARHSAPGVRT